MQKIDIGFDANDLEDMNSFADMFRDRIADSFSGKTICEQLGVSPARMTLSERLELSSKIENDTIVVSSNIFIQSDEMANEFDIKNSGVQGLIKSAAVLEIMGFERLAKQMRKLYAESLAELFMSGVRADEFAKQVISKDRSNAGKGNTSRHKETALKIAKDTWDKYPNASQNGMAEELFSYFRGKWKDNPGTKAITGWLAASGMNPDCKPKNRKFELVINK